MNELPSIFELTNKSGKCINIVIFIRKTVKVSGTSFLTVDKHCEHKMVKRFIFPVIMKLDEL